MALIETQLEIDDRIKAAFPDAVIGRQYTITRTIVKLDDNDEEIPGTEKKITETYTYQGTDGTANLIEDVDARYLNVQWADGMLNNPTTFNMPTFSLDPNILNVSKAVAGVVGTANTTNLTALTSNIVGDSGNIISQIGSIPNLTKNLTSALKNFTPPGLDLPIENIKKAKETFKNELPIAAKASADITGKMTAAVSSIQKHITPNSGLLNTALKSNIFGDLKSAAEKAGGANLPAEMTKMMSAIGNPAAFAAQAANIARNFPMINVNALAKDVISKAANGSIDIKNIVPNLQKSLGGSMSQMAKATKTPDKDAVKAPKTPKPPKKPKPIEMKNLFAEGSSASSMSDLTKTLSQFMGTMATIASQTSLMAPGPTVTSLGAKLNPSANNSAFDTGSYGRDESFAEQEKKRAELTNQIEEEMKKLQSMVDLNVLERYSYPDLIKKYPTIKPTMTVAEVLQIIKDADSIV